MTIKYTLILPDLLCIRSNLLKYFSRIPIYWITYPKSAVFTRVKILSFNLDTKMRKSIES